MKTISLLTAAAAFAACSSEPSNFSSTKGSGDSEPARRIPWPEEFLPGHSSEDGRFAGFDTGGKTMVGNNRPSSEVWINFEGAQVSAVQSPIVASLSLDAVSIPPFAVSDLGESYNGSNRQQVIDKLMREIAQRFESVDITLIDIAPARAATTIHVGGSNITPRINRLGTAPLDPGNFTSDDVGFVFSRDFAVLPHVDKFSMLVNTIAHELAHTLGTRHIIAETAVMSPELGPGNSLFDRQGSYPEGEGGENSMAVLHTNLGRGDVKLHLNKPPRITYLAAERSGNVLQLSLLNTVNAQSNPDYDLRSFDYTWTLGTAEVNGTAVRIMLADDDAHELKLSVSGLEEQRGEHREVTFIVGRGQVQ